MFLVIGSPLMCTTMQDCVTRVMYIQFEQNWNRPYREDVENLNFPYTTLYEYVNFDHKIRNPFFNQSFGFVQI